MQSTLGLIECTKVFNYDLFSNLDSVWLSSKNFNDLCKVVIDLQIKNWKILNDILVEDKESSSFEVSVWMAKPNYKHIFNYDKMKNGEWHLGDTRKNPGKQMRSIWRIGPISSSFYFRCIEAATNSGDIVYENFGLDLESMPRDRSYVSI